ncbi:MAG: PEGA domain-containing protein, partial [Sediminibacterium sp.]|nr:PEGA domain-containing protein [Sediminibacterium sp.]
NPQNNQETKDLYEVKFTSNQDNATLYLNNTWIGKTPLKYSLEKGNYTLLLKKEDCYTLKQSITVDENTNEFNLTLKPFKKLFFTGIKVGLSQSNMGILTNNAGPISPYNTYYIINNINQIFMPAAVVYPYIGINAEYFTSIKRKFSFQLEANITNIGADYLYGNNIKMQQLSIPFTAKWFFMPKRWAFTANTSYNILLNAEFNGQDILPLLQTNYFSLGVGTEIHLSPWFYVGAAYNTQQKPILANDQGNNAHNYPPINIQAFLGYRF